MLWVCVVPAARASVQLDIPPRAQWDNNNGYCGECSIQQIDKDGRNDLTTGSWTSVATNVAGTGGVVTVTESRVPGQRQRFYRVGVRMP